MKPSPLASLLRDNPIAITGMGCVSAAGDSVEALWQAAIAGRAIAGRGLAAWREFPIANQSPQRYAVCSAPPFEASESELRFARKADSCARMSLHAANLAWHQAAMNDAYAPERLGVIVGSSRGPIGKMGDSFAALEQGKVLPTLSAQSSMGSIAGMLAQFFNVKGVSTVVSATCASAAVAIGMAAEQILLGKADAMLVGGAEAPLHAVILAQLQASGVLGSHEDASKTCRPFDVTRNGMVLGEGAGFLVLEKLGARPGAMPLAKLAGWSMSVESSGRTGMPEDGSSVVRAMQEALTLAQLNPRDIGYVNAHGSGTVLNDHAEAAAQSRLFGDRGVPCSSTKPVTGHCLGATPALAAILCIEALRRQKLPPAVNCDQLDPQCPIRLATPETQPEKFTSALSNSIGFWGYHSSLVFQAAQ
jgi:3-oxoacyl-(acyl-carrier-protein) synthase